MSLYDYRQSIEIVSEGYTFHALIMAAMRQADSDNIELLRKAFPKVHEELTQRYHAPNGLLSGERATPTEEYIDF